MYIELSQDDNFNCLVYPNDNFTYNHQIGLSVISLSSIGLCANAFLIITFSLNVFYRQKSKTSSLDKLFILLSGVESGISVYWLVNAFLFFYGHTGEKLTDKKCQNCQYTALFGIFLYCFDWTLLTATIYQFKQIISNPIVAILKPDKQIRIYVVICVFVSLIAVCFSYFGDYNGVNPMFTCFVTTRPLVYQTQLGKKIRSIIFFWSLMLIPICNFFYGFYQSIVMLRNIILQKDIETRKLFRKYVSYFLIYIASTFCLFLLHLCDIFIDDRNKNDTFLSFAYGTSILNCSTPLIVALFRLVQKYNRGIINFFNRGKGLLPSEKLLDDDSKELSRTQTVNFEKLENKSIKRIMRDIYISICYLASQAKRLTKQMCPLQSQDYKETTYYNISYNELMNNNEFNIKEDFIIKEATNVDVRIYEFAPKIFSSLRETDEVTEDQIIESFLPNNNMQGIQESQGKSGNFFINTDDKKFILKTINYDDLELIKGILLEKMNDHYNKNKDSIISRIYGIYKIIMPTGFFNQEEIILILMKNVCDVFDEQIIGKYDIKGSTFDRSVTMSNMNFSKKVMKDNNFEDLEGILFINEYNSKRLLEIIKADATFFCNLGIMDYSLLVVKVKLNEDEMKYLFGMKHREDTEKDYFEFTGEGEQNSQQPIYSKEMKEIYNRQVNKANIRFDRKELVTLKKYMFPSINFDTMYIFSIIDFFQLYDFKKNLETKMKSLLAKKETISSVPPEDYAKRFINAIEQKANCKKYFDDLKQKKRILNSIIEID